MQLPAKEPIPVRVVSHNIRYAATSRFPHEQPWSTRGPLLISQLAAQATSESSSSSASPSSSSSSPPLPTPSFLPHGLPVVIGLQEVLHEQLTDILNGLNAADDAAWTHLGVGRDDGATKGEYNPILYRPRQLRLLDYRTRWLSPTPDRPSFGWGAGSRRLVTVAVFEVRRRRPGGREEGDHDDHDDEENKTAASRPPRHRFIAANTHLDNASALARSEGVRVLLETLAAVRADWGPRLGVVLTGDFNSEPGDGAYGAMVASRWMRDLYEAAGVWRRFGSYETYTGFEPRDRHTRIDFIWIGGPETTAEAAARAEEEGRTAWEVRRYEVLTNVVRDVHVSDHRAVVGNLLLLK